MTPCAHISPITIALMAKMALEPVEPIKAIEVPDFKHIRAMQNASDGLARRREQKLLNVVGAHLGKETLTIEDLFNLKGRMRCEVNKADSSESFYLDDTLLVTFLQPEFIADGDAIMVKQGYGPVGV